jgi:ethanolamine permease
MIYCAITLICTAFATIFVASSQPRLLSDAAGELLPLNFGLMRMLNISAPRATWLALPAAYATGFGFIFAYGRQMSSMARSGLFPALFKLRTKKNNSPYAALTVGSILSIIGCFGLFYGDVAYLENVFAICVLSSYTVYLFAFISYFIFNSKYSTVARAFKSPFGLVGAGLGFCIFLLGIISIVGFQKYLSIVTFVIVIVLLSIYYNLYGYKVQKFSEEEQKHLFKAYVINGKCSFTYIVQKKKLITFYSKQQ